MIELIIVGVGLLILKNSAGEIGTAFCSHGPGGYGAAPRIAPSEQIDKSEATGTNRQRQR